MLFYASSSPSTHVQDMDLFYASLLGATFVDDVMSEDEMVRQTSTMLCQMPATSQTLSSHEDIDWANFDPKWFCSPAKAGSFENDCLSRETANELLVSS